MKYLLSISIGPVQDFIATARRSRDLWFGSWLLSELSKAAALAIVQNSGGDLDSLVFPAPASIDALSPNDNTLSVANKIVGAIELAQWDGCASIGEVGQRIKVAVDARLEDIKGKAYSQHSIPGPQFHSRVADLQVEDLVEFIWTAVPFEDGTRDYRAARALSEQLLAARKVTRNFAKVQWGDTVPKSSLDGQRESVIDESAFKRVLRKGKWEYERTDYEFRRDYGVRPGERLCGIGLLKRHGQRGQDNRIFSTSHVAAQPILEKLDKPEHEGFLKSYIEALRGAGANLEDHSRAPVEHPIFGRYDGHLLFKERLKEFVEPEKLASVQEALNHFFKQTGLPRPNPYYALLLADGDRMGKAIDGLTTQADHRRLSGLLADFASSVPNIVRKHMGSLIYAGGDDVLAFVPLHTALNCARELAVDFNQRFDKKFPIDEDGEINYPTLSAGIAVAHHLEPLQDALTLARDAEKKAKGIPGKNALAVIVDKRSGASRAVADTWANIDGRLQTFIEWHCADQIPDKAGYELRDLALRLEGSKVETKEDGDYLDRAKRAEATRILRRKRGGHGREEVGDAVFAEFENMLRTANRSDKRHIVDQLADELIIAKVFAEAASQAKKVVLNP
jgi:CRISPR-associated protein Cmr2